MEKDNNKKKIGKTSFKCIKDCLMMLCRYSKCYILLNLLMIIIEGLIPAVLIVIMQRIINMLQCGQYKFSDIVSYIGIYVVINVFIALASTLHSYYNNQFSLRFTQCVNLKILDKATQLSLTDYEDSETYNIINRALNQKGTSILSYISELLEVIRQLVIIVSTTTILFKFKWWIVLIALIVPAVRCALIVHIDREWYELRVSRTQKERQNWYINYILLTGRAFKEIKILGLSQYLIQKYKKRSDGFITEDLKIQRKTMILTIISDIIDWLITGGLFAYTVLLGVVGKILIGDVTAYINCIENIKDSAQVIFSEVGSIAGQSLYIALLFEYLNIPIKRQEAKEEITYIEKIELNHVSFRYGEEYVLRDISLTLYKGQTLALVGQNGSGKTTLIKLVLGFYDNYEGEIYVNGIELREVNLDTYRKRIACVFQDYEKFETTVRENVAFGDLSKMECDDEIWKALKNARVHERIRDIGELDTIIGNWFGEIELSAGEWQRIAIARALIKNADMYVLDEPDASLDVFKQREIIQLFREAIENRIGIYISHKINYVNELVHRIVVLQNGEIAEIGTHKELMDKEGQYYYLYLESMKRGKKNEQ